MQHYLIIKTNTLVEKWKAYCTKYVTAQREVIKKNKKTSDQFRL